MSFDPFDTSRGEQEARLNELADLTRKVHESDTGPLRKRLAYLESRVEDLAQRVAHDDTKFAAMAAKIERLEICVAAILSQN